MTALRSLGYAIVFYAGTVVMVLWALVLSKIAPKTVTPHVRNWGAIHDWASRHMVGIRPKVEGVMPSGPVLVAMKHQSMYETVHALVLLGDPVVVLKRELADIPFFGGAVRAHGAIPVEREAGASALREMLAAAKAAVKTGRPILIFPEGTRVPVGETPPLRPGFAALYKMLGLPVVPVAMDAGRLWPKSFVKRPGTITFRVGETLPPGLPRAEIEARVHAAINALERRDPGAS